MKTQKKLSILFISIISTSFIVLIILISIGLYNIGSKQATDKANITTELVKDGLTAHMLNGTMDNRAFFIERIENSKNIDELWIARSPSVIKQFGEGTNNEVPRDKYDLQVIKTGKPYTKLFESAQNAKLRFTVPYTATSHTNPNCMSCHVAEEGEVLGTISMIFDITETRNNGIATIIYITITAILVLLLVLFSLHYSLRPVWELFSSINKVMNLANKGNYSYRVETSNKDNESKQVATWINNLLGKLEDTLKSIQSNVKDFFISYEHTETDPLLDTEEVIVEMAKIYKFKKTIEFDETKTIVYERLGTVLKDNFKLTNFKFFESNNTNGEIQCVYGGDKTDGINQNIQNRVLRTKHYVSSDQFKNICHTDEENYGHYLCIPFSISDDFELLIHFTFETQDELEETKRLLPKIENYVDQARPELVSKNLTEILRRSSTTDQLTGLKNRKYLDEFIDTAAPQTIRDNANYGILMLDIDYFKLVNDTYGHDVGDSVIKVLSKSILKCIRDSDIAFRYGGEEFLVMLHNCDNEHIDLIANKIRTTFGQEVIRTSTGKEFSKTLSIGYSNFPLDADSIWRCIKFADTALYAAKNGGRNQVQKFIPEMLGEGELKNNYGNASTNTVKKH